MTLIQIAIALAAAITILTRNKGIGAVCVGVVSIAIGGLAFLHV